MRGEGWLEGSDSVSIGQDFINLRQSHCLSVPCSALELSPELSVPIFLQPHAGGGGVTNAFIWCTVVTHSTSNALGTPRSDVVLAHVGLYLKCHSGHGTQVLSSQSPRQSKRTRKGTDQGAHWVKELAAKHDDPSSSPGTHTSTVNEGKDTMPPTHAGWADLNRNGVARVRRRSQKTEVWRNVRAECKCAVLT